MDNYLLRLSLALCVAPAQNNDSADAAHSWSKQRLSKTTPSRAENTNCVFSLLRGEGLLCAAPCYATPSAPTAALARSTPLFPLSLAIFALLSRIFLSVFCCWLHGLTSHRLANRPLAATANDLGFGSCRLCCFFCLGLYHGVILWFGSTLANNAATTTHSL